MAPSQLPGLLLSALLAATPSLAMIHCDNLRVDGHSFNIKPLAGPHTVLTTRAGDIPGEYFNTTYTVDICSPLEKDSKAKKDEQCPNGTRVCAIEHLLKDETDTVEKVYAIAGSLEHHGGSSFEYDLTRLSTSDSNADSQKVGVRIVMRGGKHPLSAPFKERKEQKAIFEFLCDPERDGTEGEWGVEESESKVRREDGEEGEDGDGEDNGDEGDDAGDGEGDDEDDGTGESTVEHQLLKENAALIWESFEEENDVGVLRMTWHTKHACEKREDSGDDTDGDDNSSAHWGFFTWFIIIVFLAIAAYLIFGSWLNYNRYGARGWDLIPHGDTIRDIPYLFQDWIRRVLNTVQGAGSRGGYSAV